MVEGVKDALSRERPEFDTVQGEETRDAQLVCFEDA